MEARGEASRGPRAGECRRAARKVGSPGRCAAVPVLLFLAALAAPGVAAAAGKPSYYEVLGVPKDADERAIKSSYRKMALKWHPDKNPDDREAAEVKFREVAEAYEVLSDPAKRRQYDQVGHVPSGGGDGGGTGGGRGFDFGHFGSGGFGGFKDPNDLFKEMFGDSDPFADFSTFFSDVHVEEEGGAGDEAMANLEVALANFYRSVGQSEKGTVKKARELLRMPKWAGKERKMLGGLRKKYADPRYAAALEGLKQAFDALERSRGSSGGGGGFNFDFGGMGDLGDLGGFSGLGDLGKAFGGGFGGGFDMGMGGGFGGASASFSSSFSYSSSGGKTVRSETKVQGGKRVTKTIETDAKSTRATMEEQEGGRIKRQRGVRHNERLSNDEM